MYGERLKERLKKKGRQCPSLILVSPSDPSLISDEENRLGRTIEGKGKKQMIWLRFHSPDRVVE